MLKLYIHKYAHAEGNDRCSDGFWSTPWRPVLMCTHVLRKCGKVLADQLNFHDEGDTSLRRDIPRQKRPRRARPPLRAILNYRWVPCVCVDIHVLRQTATLRPMNDRTSSLSRIALSRSAPPNDYFFTYRLGWMFRAILYTQIHSWHISLRWCFVIVLQENC